MPSDGRLNHLLQTLAQIAVSVDVQPTLALLVESLQRLIRFDGGGIFVRETGRDVVRARAVTGYPEHLEMPTAIGVVGEVLRTGQPRLVRDVRSESAYVPVRPLTHAQLTVPLTSPRGILGAIVLECDRPAAFDEQDLALATLFAQQATVVIERALLHEQQMRQSRLERDMEIAREIVRGLLPSAAPLFPGLDVFGRSVTAETVGGDAFDFVPYPDAQVGVSVSDAKGKGLPGALLAVAHRAMVHALVNADLRLRSAFAHVSRLIERSLPSGSFVTTFYGLIDLAERRMVYVNAGHPPSLIVRADGHIELLTPTGPALGFPDAGPMREGNVTFQVGEGLVLYTDGVQEAGPSPEAFFEIDGIRTCVAQHWSGKASDVGQAVLDEAVRRSAGTLADDSTIVVVKFD